jgi:hypothetical protein
MEIYDGTPELHPVTGPDSDDDNARAGVGTSIPPATAMGIATRHAKVETRRVCERFRALDMRCLLSA